MKYKILLLVFCSFVGLTNANTITQTTSNQTTAELGLKFAEQKLKNQELDLKLNNLEHKTTQLLDYQELRKNVLDSQEKSIEWWLEFVGIFFTIFGIILVYFLNHLGVFYCFM